MIPYEDRAKVYINALVHYGDRDQMVKAVEELAECQQTICKAILGQGNIDHLAEEVADATIMLEQIRLYFGINDRVIQYMDEKVQRLDGRLRALTGE